MLDYHIYSKKCCSAYLKAAFTSIWKLHMIKNFIDYGIIIFCIKQKELTSFDFDYTRAVALIRGKYSIFF